MSIVKTNEKNNMIKILSTLVLFSLLIIGMSPLALAESVKWVPATEIEGLKVALETAKKKLRFNRSWSNEILPTPDFISFPQEVAIAEESRTKLYAHFGKYGRTDNYEFSINTTPNCEYKGCNRGRLIIQDQENITIYFDRANNQATSLVALANGISGFYTHGYPMGNYWPAHLDWRKGQILYRLELRDIEDKKVFIKMANSIIRQLPTGNK